MLHVDNPEVRTLFEPESEPALFTDERDLCDKIDHYLTQPELRVAMIERAYQKAVPAYSYDARAEVMSGAILAVLEKQGAAEKGPRDLLRRTPEAV
jgi:spore maturation protein CgeB